jgi:hypothetical protein
MVSSASFSLAAQLIGMLAHNPVTLNRRQLPGVLSLMFTMARGCESTRGHVDVMSLQRWESTLCGGMLTPSGG